MKRTIVSPEEGWGAPITWAASPLHGMYWGSYVAPLSQPPEWTSKCSIVTSARRGSTGAFAGGSRSIRGKALSSSASTPSSTNARIATGDRLGDAGDPEEGVGLDRL